LRADVGDARAADDDTASEAEPLAGSRAAFALLAIAVETLQHVAVSTSVDGGFARDMLVLASFVVVGVVAAAATLRRCTP